ncbi:MAG: preprotein translocase subunit SecD, partial [Methanoregula sp.]|nr:preprotein translocase subunit SecD [Methanoregula sp.]
MNTKGLKGFISDWRIAVLLVLIVLSVIAIYPHIDEEGRLASNIQYGLDLQQGAWLQLDMQAEVVGYTTGRP